MCHSVAIWAKGDQVFITVLPSVLHKNDVVNVNVDVAACRDGASMSRFNKNPPTYVSGYCGSRTAQLCALEFLTAEDINHVNYISSKVSAQYARPFAETRLASSSRR